MKKRQGKSPRFAATFWVTAAVATTAGCVSGRGVPTIDPATIRSAEHDPTRDKIVEVIDRETETMSLNTELTRKALLAALTFGKPKGVTVLPPVCKQAVGCRVDVLYASPEAFATFETGKFDNPHSIVGSWFGGNGRSPLLKDKERGLMATWFFLDQNDHLAIERREIENQVPR
jgi:hypothetical protein